VASGLIYLLLVQDAHLQIVRKTGSSKDMKQHAVGCKYMDIVENCR